MKNSVYLILTVFGLVLAILGLFLSKLNIDGIMIALPYVCIGIGCGSFGHGMGQFISNRALKNSATLRKQMEIERNDERNIMIANYAKGKAYDAMIFIFGSLLASFSLMNLEMYAILLLVFAYLLVVGISIYYRIKYEKEM